MSAHPGHSPIPGDNPNYYNESASGPAELAGDAPQSHPVQPPQIQYNQYPPPSGPSPLSAESQYFPPPPPGPPPTNQQYDQYPPPPPGPPPANLDHQYYPPPPPGPPPNPGQGQGQGQGYSPQSPYFPAPPSYSELDGGGFTVTDEKPPILPPRPLSSQGASSQGAQAIPQAALQFPPPPTSPTHLNPAASHGQHHPPAASAGASPSSSKSGFGRKLYEWGVKAGVPINKLTNKLGSEAFWPTSLDKECDKAARILKSFCKDGFYTTTTTSASNPPAPSQGSSSSNLPPPSGPASKPKVLCKIPRTVIANAKGLAIFTTFRTGFHISGAGGSGLVVARLPDGSWSPPAGFLVHTLGAGIMAGLDIYDCVCVLNTAAAVEAFTRPRLSLGGEMTVAAGPVGAGTVVEAALAKGSKKPVWSYMKSRGLYGGVQVDGTVIVHRPDANAAFYGVDRIGVDQILKGEVRDNTGRTAGKKDEGLVLWPEGARQLVEVLKAAEGKRADEGVMRELGDQPTPGDLAPTPEPYAAANADAKDRVRYA
ncbi:ligase of succinyl-coa [Hypoxylon texense]